MKRETLIKRIKGYLERRNANVMGFYEPYMFNCPPMIGGCYNLDSISITKSGALSFMCSKNKGCNWKYKIVEESELSTDELKEIVDFLCEFRKYIDKYATIQLI